jgi:trimeric autotransporter adhesin
MRANDLTTGRELWKSDGTDAGTVMVKDIYPGNSAEPYGFSSVNGILFFAAKTASAGHELWKSDGTDAGTVMVQEFIPGATGGSPNNITPTGTLTFLTAIDANGSSQLYVANTNAILPLKLLDFSGRLKNNDGLLTWKTTEEENTSRFEIQRSFDGSNFSAIGSVTATGNSIFGNAYTFTDKNITSLSSKIVYYRLKMIDTDGKYSYSKLIALNIKNKESIAILYPNPATSNATLMISVQKEEHLNYTVTDQSGRVLINRKVSVYEGSNTIAINIEMLKAGFYTLSIKGPVTNKQIRFVKH